MCVALHSLLSFAEACWSSKLKLHRLRVEFGIYFVWAALLVLFVEDELLLVPPTYDAAIEADKLRKIKIINSILFYAVWEKDERRWWSALEPRCRDQWLVTRMTGVRDPEEDEGGSCPPPPVFHPRCGQLVSLSKANRTASRSHATQVWSLTSLLTSLRPSPKSKPKVQKKREIGIRTLGLWDSYGKNGFKSLCGSEWSSW